MSHNPEKLSWVALCLDKVRKLTVFGANYSRTMFWIVTLTAILVGVFFLAIAKEFSGNDILVMLIFKLVLSFVFINTLANRIRDYGSNPWLALWALLPLVGFVQALYFGIRHKKPVSGDQNSSSQNSKQQQSKSPEIKDFHYTPPTQSSASSSNASTVPRPRLPLKDFN